jgi:maltodextrin utilization protein YvdJ
MMPQCPGAGLSRPKLVAMVLSAATSGIVRIISIRYNGFCLMINSLFGSNIRFERMMPVKMIGRNI